jgi:hypothetical protein
VGILFKGSGFYCTDHRSSASSTTPANEKDEKSKAELKPEKKEEPKPEKQD